MASVSMVDSLYNAAHSLKNVSVRVTALNIRLVAHVSFVSPSQTAWKMSGRNDSMMFIYFCGVIENLPARVSISTEFRLYCGDVIAVPVSLSVTKLSVCPSAANEAMPFLYWSIASAKAHVVSMDTWMPCCSVVNKSNTSLLICGTLATCTKHKQ